MQIFIQYFLQSYYKYLFKIFFKITTEIIYWHFTEFLLKNLNYKFYKDIVL